MDGDSRSDASAGTAASAGDMSAVRAAVIVDATLSNVFGNNIFASTHSTGKLGMRSIKPGIDNVHMYPFTVVGLVAVIIPIGRIVHKEVAVRTQILIETVQPPRERIRRHLGILLAKGNVIKCLAAFGDGLRVALEGVVAHARLPLAGLDGIGALGFDLGLEDVKVALLFVQMAVRVAGFGDVEALEFNEIGVLDATWGVGMAPDDLAFLEGFEDMSLLLTIVVVVVVVVVGIETAQMLLGMGWRDGESSRHDQRRDELDLILAFQI